MTSMTGYGRSEARGAQGAWLVECASVNRRQLEVAVQLPREWSALEPMIRMEVEERAVRGRVTVVISQQPVAEGAFPGIRAEAAEAAYRDLARVQKQLGLGGEITLDQLLRHPAVFVSSDRSPSGEEVWGELRAALVAALDAMAAMRRKEGANLAAEVRKLLREIKRPVSQARRIARGTPARRRAALEARLAEIHLPAPADPARLALEIAIQADRCDISEELARIESHFGQFVENLSLEGPVGRTLEFLAQEIQRELNTAGAKAGEAEIARLVVEAKAALEKIREQLSNIE